MNKRRLILVILAYFTIVLCEWAWNYYVATSDSSLARATLAAYAYRYPNGKGSNALGFLFELPAALLGLVAGIVLKTWRPSAFFYVLLALAVGNVCLIFIYPLALPPAALWWWPHHAGGWIFGFFVSLVICGLFGVIGRRGLQNLRH